MVDFGKGIVVEGGGGDLFRRVGLNTNYLKIFLFKSEIYILVDYWELGDSIIVK